MALKYQIEYLDVEGNEHLITIDDPNYEGSVILVNGYAELFYTEIGEILQPIRGQGLRVYLDADTNLTFNDLYSEQDRTFKIVYKRGGQTLFEGWLDSENWFEDFVDDKWVVSFDCLDGLGYLEDLAYVQHTGVPYTGKERQSIILANALKRTGLEHLIYTDIDIYYTGLGTSLVNILYETYANQNRYVKDDGETIMSCLDVIRDILEPYGACIVNANLGGVYAWYVFKPNQIYSSKDYNAKVLNSDGTINTYLTPFDLSKTIQGYTEGLDKTALHYAGGNQSIRNNKSYGAYRINYKYGLKSSLIENSTFFTADGLTYVDWIINPLAGGVTVPAAGESGATIAPKYSLTPIISLQSDPVDIVSGGRLSLLFSVASVIFGGGSGGYIGLGSFRTNITIQDGGIYYYFDSNINDWVQDPQPDDYFSTIDLIQNEGSYIFSFDLPPSPVDGELIVKILQPFTVVQFEGTWELNVKVASVTISDESSSLPVKGEFHTFQRVSQPSAKIPDNKEVFTGDNVEEDIYTGTLYESDQVTQTSTWFRKGVTEALPILRLMGEETMRINQSVSRVLSGGVYNYFPYLSRVTLEGLDGVFMCTKYNYNTKDNLIQAEFKQIFGDELGADLFYELTFDYGNVVEPTITG